MPSLRPFTVPLLAGILLVPAFAGQKPAQAPKPQSPKAQSQARAQAKQQTRQPDNHPGEQVLDKMSRMTPEEREAALSHFTPARRAQIEEKIRSFQKLPHAAQTRTLNSLERLNSLPPQKQNQVRRSMKDYDQMPEERKAVITQEMQHMARMPADERRSHMNTAEFRNRYSPAEQQMMANMSEVLPSHE
jgi:hypothetical protein